MAEVAKFGDVSLATPTIGFEHTLAGKLAGEDLEAGDAVAFDEDGMVYLAGGVSNPAAGDARPICHGFVVDDYFEGQAVTVFDEVRLHYAEALDIPTLLYLSPTVAGGLSDTAPWTGAAPIGYAVDEMRVHLKSNWQLPTVRATTTP